MADIPQDNSGMTFSPNVINNSGNFARRTAGKGSQWIILLIGIAIYLSDLFIFKFDGINLVSVYRTLGISGIGNLLFRGILVNAVFWILVAAFFFIKRPQNKEEFLSMSLLIAAIVFVATLVGLTNALSISNIATLIHLLFIIFGLRNGILTDYYDKPTSNYYTILIIFLDFFTFNIISSIFPATATNLSRVIIPIFPLTTLILMEGSTARNWLLFLITVFYILIVAQTYYANINFQQTLGQNKINAGQQQAMTAWEKFKAIINGSMQMWDTQQKIISGDYYTGQVEQNQAKPLGVFLEDMKGDTEFMTNEKIVVWANLKVQSMEDIDKTGESKNITVNCFLKDGINPPIPGNITPRANFKVTSYEEEFIQCEFDNNKVKLKPGYYQVIFNATFDFDTQGSMKVYYMDKERKRTLMANGVDILSEYGLTDTNPEAKFTNGPVMIGMETTSPLPIGVPVETGAPNEDKFSSYIGITIDKHWPEGGLNAMKKLWIALPEGTDFGEGCGDFINLDSKKWEEETGESDQVMVSIYQLKDEKINTDNLKGYKLPKSYKCSLKLVKRNDLLGTTPIALRYFKVYTEYTYMISKTTNINIKSSGEDVTTTVGGSTSSTGTGGLTITGPGYVGKTEIEKKIISEASAKGVPTYIALSVVSQESSFKQCRDGTTNCGTSNIDGVYCSSSSCGLMQINVGVWKDEYTSSAVSRCGCAEGQTSYDWDCNIKCGMRILKDYYNTYANNDITYTTAVNNKCTDSAYNSRYLAYKDWDRALRAYNGFGCDNSVQGNYVENVKNRFSNYK